MGLYGRVVVAIGEWMGGPEAAPVDYAAVIIGAGLAILIAGLVTL